MYRSDSTQQGHEEQRLDRVEWTEIPTPAGDAHDGLVTMHPFRASVRSSTLKEPVLRALVSVPPPLPRCHANPSCSYPRRASEASEMETSRVRPGCLGSRRTAVSAWMATEEGRGCAVSCHDIHARPLSARRGARVPPAEGSRVKTQPVASLLRQNGPTVRMINGHFSHPVTVRGRARVLRPLSDTETTAPWQLGVCRAQISARPTQLSPDGRA